MKKLFRFTFGIWLFASYVLPASAAFSSLYVFGDALSSTADGTDPTKYYDGRDSNGRVWVEVLAQRQGLNFDTNNNDSFYDHTSAQLLTEINTFTAPPDVTNDLFIVWVCNADTFDAAAAIDNSNAWVTVINQSQTNHFQIITNLYALGVRTLILPNAVDLSKIPAYDTFSSYTNVLRNGCTAYNVAFSNTINQARASCPGLTIYAPDFFTLLNNILTNAAYYGLTNVLKNGLSIDALNALYSQSPVNLNGPGTNFIFWDYQDPTAQLHAIIADVTQQMISPVQVGKIVAFTGSNRLDIVNYPAGLDGFVDGLTNLAQANWSANTNLSSSSTTLSVFVPVSGPQQFYRLRFPYAWSWP